jgi:site-specific DNA-methyltransferase (adenine-specific)
MRSKKEKNNFSFQKKDNKKYFVKEEFFSYGNILLKPIYCEQNLGITLYQGDCFEILNLFSQRFPEGFVDVIFADPPYFLSNDGISCHSGKMVSVNKGDWDKSKGTELNHQFNLKWLSICQKILKPNGTIWVSGTSHIIHSIGFAMQQLNFKILNDITWVKPNPPPNISCRYFTHATETILWAAKNSKSKHFFNYEEMRKMNGGKQMKSVWYIYPPQAWEKEFGKHPTQKPVELIKRILIASSRPDELVLDPFMGSGTTGVAAVQLKRKFIGIELDKNYIEIAIKRIKKNYINTRK